MIKYLEYLALNNNFKKEDYFNLDISNIFDKKSFIKRYNLDSIKIRNRFKIKNWLINSCLISFLFVLIATEFQSKLYVSIFLILTLSLFISSIISFIKVGSIDVLINNFEKEEWEKYTYLKYEEDYIGGMIKINSPSAFGILADTDNKPEIINIIKNFKNDNLRRKFIRRIIKLENF